MITPWAEEYPMAQAGTGKRYGTENGRGELSVWGGIASARLSDYAGALETSPQAILDAVDTEGVDPIVDTADPKGQAVRTGFFTDVYGIALPAGGNPMQSRF